LILAGKRIGAQFDKEIDKAARLGTET